MPCALWIGQPTGLTAIAEVRAGVFATCARLTAGGLRCWGGNHSGDVGDRTQTDRLAPVAVHGFE